MQLKEVSKIDDKLLKMYENQVTTIVETANWTDKSDILIQQMNFLALSNKSFLNLK